MNPVLPNISTVAAIYAGGYVSRLRSDDRESAALLCIEGLLNVSAAADARAPVAPQNLNQRGLVERDTFDMLFRADRRSPHMILSTRAADGLESRFGESGDFSNIAPMTDGGALITTSSLRVALDYGRHDIAGVGHLQSAEHAEVFGINGGEDHYYVYMIHASGIRAASLLDNMRNNPERLQAFHPGVEVPFVNTPSGRELAHDARHLFNGAAGDEEVHLRSHFSNARIFLVATNDALAQPGIASPADLTNALSRNAATFYGDIPVAEALPPPILPECPTTPLASAGPPAAWHRRQVQMIATMAADRMGLRDAHSRRWRPDIFRTPISRIFGFARSYFNDADEPSASPLRIAIGRLEILQHAARGDNPFNHSLTDLRGVVDALRAATDGRRQPQLRGIATAATQAAHILDLADRDLAKLENSLTLHYARTPAPTPATVAQLESARFLRELREEQETRSNARRADNLDAWISMSRLQSGLADQWMEMNREQAAARDGAQMEQNRQQSAHDQRAARAAARELSAPMLGSFGLASAAVSAGQSARAADRAAPAHRGLTPRQSRLPAAAGSSATAHSEPPASVLHDSPSATHASATLPFEAVARATVPAVRRWGQIARLRDVAPAPSTDAQAAPRRQPH